MVCLVAHHHGCKQPRLMASSARLTLVVLSGIVWREQPNYPKSSKSLIEGLEQHTV